MNKRDEAIVVDELTNGQWVNDIDAALPEDVAKGKKQGQLPDQLRSYAVGLRV
jgi:hypothetical protein